MKLFLILLLTATIIFSQAQQISSLAKDESAAPLNEATVSSMREYSKAVGLPIIPVNVENYIIK